MSRVFRRRITAIIAAALFVAMFSSIGYAAGSSVTISSYTAPSALIHGQKYVLKGTLKSNYTIKRVEIGVVSSKGKWTGQKYDNRSVNSRSFSIGRADSSIRFGKLSPGSYYYRIYAHTNDGRVHTVLNKKFTVKQNPGKIKTSGITYPDRLTKGKGFVLKGKVTSSKKISKVTVGVTNTSGTWTSVKCTRNVDSTSFNVASVDPKIKFGKLAAGSYIYKIVVTTTGGSKAAFQHAFTVTGASSSASSSGSSGTKTNTAASKVTLSGVNRPGTYRVGARFTPVGTINSNDIIKRVEIGIVFAPTNKWLAHKYDARPGTKSFNISNAASKLSFDTLPAGTFRYRIYVHTDKGVYIALNHLFTVTSSGKPLSAVNWATRVANDNSFTYGARPATAKVGCYYCGTNKKNKPKGYEKTYVCMTFVHAAFAHGAKDQGMLADCKGGKYTLSLTDWNFSRYDCWEKIGLCRDLTVNDLLPGDVIIWWADDDYSGHASIYAGNGNIVDAGRVGWSADSIAVRKGSAASYLRTGANHSSRSYVMRYRK